MGTIEGICMHKDLKGRSMFAAMAGGLLLITVAGATDTTAQTKTCFPTCSETDARFLSLVGTNLASLAGDEIIFSFRVPSTTASFNPEIFDGETGGIWDVGTNPVEFTVFADPDNDGLIEPGETEYGPYSGAAMVDNGWYMISIPTSNDARLSTGGDYFYNLRARLTDASIPNTWSNFKLRANADILLQTQRFAFAAPMYSVAEARVIYPNYDGGDQTTTTYDGTWKFFMQVEKAVVFGTRPDTGYVDVWDGDMDYGSYDCSARDDDDMNTPNAVLPPWAIGTSAMLEGAVVTDQACTDAAGNPNGLGFSSGKPPDDSRSSLFRRSPSVNYLMVGPDGALYPNENPSGSQEWERFSASINPATAGNPLIHDYQATALPDGIYELRISGMDIANLNAWRSSFRFVGICDATATPCIPVTCTVCPTCEGATATKGYWKNHPEAWPVSSLTIGGRLLGKTDLMAILASDCVDNFYIVASQLVAAMLNVANGAEDECISTTIASANQWISENWNNRPIGSGPVWRVGRPLGSRLDAFNNGELCAPSRDAVNCESTGGSGEHKGKNQGKLK